jgi:hypothetical protein
MGVPPADRPVRWRRALLLGALAPLAWGLLHLARLDPDATERWYSRGLYRRVQVAQAWLHGWCPVSLSEVLLVLVAGWMMWRICRASRQVRRGVRTWRNLLGHAAGWTLSVVGIVAMAFQLLWGLNHARPKLADLHGLDVRPVQTEELRSLVWALHADAQLDRPPNTLLGAIAHVLAWDQATADEALSEAWLRAGTQHPYLEGPVVGVRGALGSRLLTWFGVSGIYSPFTGEPHVNTEMPRLAQPFTTCHEIAHQRGIAREDEANFVAWIVCNQSSEPYHRYSGNLLALSYALVAWYREHPELVRSEVRRMQPEVRKDLLLLWDFWDERRTTLTEVANETNDLFLKGQGQELGSRSYGRMVDLLIAWRRRPAE